MFLARNDRRGVYKGSFWRGGIALGNLPEDVESVLIRLSQATEMPSNFQAESGSQLHSPTTTDGLYGVLSAKIACSRKVSHGVCDNRISTVESFRLIRNGELYYVSENQSTLRQFSTHVYARRDGIGTLTAISVSAPVVIASMKPISEASAKRHPKRILAPVKNNFVFY